MATQKQADEGFKAQNRVCNILNEQFVKKNGSYFAVETDKETDLKEHYDIGVYNKNQELVKRFDVKSTSYENGKISYTIRNVKGETPVTVCKENNKDGIQLVFVFGRNFNKMYFVDMDLWYKFVEEQVMDNADLPSKTYVMDRNFKHYTKDLPSKGVTDLFEYYNVHSVTVNVCGDELKSWIANAYVNGEFDKEVELEQGYNGDWYFENGSRYILVTESQIRELCIGSGHIINT